MAADGGRMTARSGGPVAGQRRGAVAAPLDSSPPLVHIRARWPDRVGTAAVASSGLGVEAARMLVDTLSQVAAALTFSRSAFDDLSLQASLLVLGLAAGGEALGQSMILTLNRVGGLRFVLALIAIALSNVLSAIVMVLGTVVAAALLLDEPLHLRPTLSVFALAFAPRLLSPLVIAPYVGEAIDRGIEIWVMLAVVFGLHHGLGLHLAAAAVVAALGWLSLRMVNRLLGRPFGRGLRRLERWLTGAGPRTFANIPDELLDLARGDGERR